MSYCTACGTAKEAGSQYCTGCGAPLTGTEDDESDRRHAPLPAASPTWPDVSAQSRYEIDSWPAEQPQSRSRGRLVLILATMALLVGAGGVAAWAALTHGTDSSALPAPSLTAPPASSAGTSTSQPTSPSSVISSEDTALNQLTRQASLDRPQVQRELAEAWVPQLSSKQWGLVVDGMTYRYTDILNDHLRLRSAYDARLVWSSDWSSFGKDNFYVTVAPVPFTTPAAANAWCDTQGIDPENCFAKRLSAVAGPEGSTVSR
ncbi:MAG: zinc ribbon domain-containing protein [Actinobacteria bacterium]|nr:zinc ribbon domain-containing protein [Actinomycetota bacterium]